MSQQDVLESLEKSKKELSAKQISKKIGICNNGVHRALRGLLKEGLIKSRKGDCYGTRQWSIKSKKSLRTSILKCRDYQRMRKKK